MELAGTTNPTPPRPEPPIPPHHQHLVTRTLCPPPLLHCKVLHLPASAGVLRDVGASRKFLTFLQMGLESVVATCFMKHLLQQKRTDLRVGGGTASLPLVPIQAAAGKSRRKYKCEGLGKGPKMHSCRQRRIKNVSKIHSPGTCTHSMFYGCLNYWQELFSCIPCFNF